MALFDILSPRRLLVTLSLCAACATADADAPAPSADAAFVPAPAPQLAAPLASDGGAPADAAAAPSVPFDVWRRREPIYELYVRHFSAAGDFKGVEAKLPELKALGIGIVWLLHRAIA